MQLSSTFYNLNLYVVFGVLFLFLLMATQVGFLFGRFLKTRYPKKSYESSDFIPSTILGVVSLILGFTFSMAISRHEIRKELVVKESNAIGTVLLRSKLFNQQNGQEVRDILKKYVDTRLAFFDAESDIALIERAEKQAVHLQNQLWDQVIQITKVERGPLGAQIVAAVNEVIDRQAERSMALRNTIPEIVYWISLIIAAVGLGFLAFERGAQSILGRWKVSILALLFASVFTLIHDLDRPRAGTITVSQESMRALQKSLNQEQ